MDSSNCPICASRLEPAIFHLADVPTLDGAVSKTRAQALARPVGDVAIALCQHCGWTGNAAFDPARLSYDEYHFSLQHSPAFEAFVAELVDRLATRYDLAGGRVLDVGCGSGDFLRTFARRVAITGLGIDPSITAATEAFDRGTVTFERGVLEPRHGDFDAGLVCCRHVLNSMPDPIGLLREIRETCGRNPDTVFYLEVPHADRTFNDDIVWNLAYEHHNWFNEASFRVLCERSGFEVLDMGPCWRGEYLGAEVRSASPRPDAVAPAAAIEKQRANLERFARDVQAYAGRWSERLAELHRAGRRVAIWGAGARALLFLRQVDDADHVGRVVDINPVRQGHYLAGIGVRIDPPESLCELQPDLILISNAAFADEIREQAAGLGLSAEMEVFSERHAITTMSEDAQPLISVGLPVYNGEAFISVAIESVLNQTVSDLELIICDNASTDATEQICRDFAARDTRIRYIRQEKNLGVSPNFNRAFHEARGRFFKWITHDDAITPDCFEKTLAVLESHPGASLCHSQVHLIDEQGETIEYYDTGLDRIDDARPSVRFGQMICKPHQCLECDGLMPREAIAATTLYSSFPGADRALITETALVGPILRTDEPLFLTREHTTRYRRAQTTPESRLATYDTARSGEKIVATWEMYRDYWRMVRVHVQDRRERRRCYGHLLKWWFVNWNTARVLVDIISIVFPGFMWRAEQFKQRVFSPEPGPNIHARQERR